MRDIGYTTFVWPFILVDTRQTVLISLDWQVPVTYIMQMHGADFCHLHYAMRGDDLSFTSLKGNKSPD